MSDSSAIRSSIPANGDATAGPARLVMMRGPREGRLYVIDRPLVIGRAQKAAISIDDPGVSRQHAHIVPTSNGSCLLKDLSSRNGTFVNGKPIAHAVLQPGDQIQIGTGITLAFTHHRPTENELLQRQRLESIGRMSAGLAHDLNNLVGVFIAGTDYLRRLPVNRCVGSAEVRESIDDLAATAERAAELVGSVLGFSRDYAPSYERVDVTGLCHEVARFVRRLLDNSIEIQLRAETELSVQGSRIALHQVLVNLCINARDAMPDGGVVSIDARTEVVPPTAAAAVAHRCVALQVSDTGTGMSDAVVKRIFDPFFTTKGGGVGLGLATARDLITRHGGDIEVRSQPGRGTAFVLRLPVAPPAHQEEPRAEVVGTVPPTTTRETRVLLVDDDDLVRRGTARLLRQHGYVVHEAHSGRQALTCYQQDRPSIVLMDLDMPGMSGEDAAVALLDLDPEARIVFLTGHDAPNVRLRLDRVGSCALLSKPCRTDTLLAAIQAAPPASSRGGLTVQFTGMPAARDRLLSPQDEPTGEYSGVQIRSNAVAALRGPAGSKPD